MPRKTKQQLLLEKLQAFPDVASALQTLQSRKVGPKDESLLTWVDLKVKASVGHDGSLSRAWNKEKKDILARMKYGTETDSGTLGAMIMAGALICRDDVRSFREDLHPSIYMARRSFHPSYKLPTSPQGVGPLPAALRKTANTAVSIYKTLTKNMTAGGVLDTSIKTILESPSRPIRLGPRLMALDLQGIHDAYEERFPRLPDVHTHGGPQPGIDQQIERTTAPVDFSLEVLKYECNHVQENSGTDEIFWLGFFHSVENLEEQYNKIEAAIEAGTQDEIDLSFKWQTTNWQSELATGVTDNTYVEIGQQPFSAVIHKGLCPWAASFTCIEDDDAEYNAVSEVLDQISEVAQSVSNVASMASAIAGPTVVGAAAGAVATIAGFVQAAAEIADAIVSIVNFFDKDDTLGHVFLSGIGDYADHPSGSDQEEWHQMESAGAGGDYRLQTQLHFSAQRSPFDRVWRFEADTKEIPIYWNPRGATGGAKEIDVLHSFSRPVDWVDSYIAPPRHGKDWHAEFTEDFHLVPGYDNIVGKGEVHIGVRGHHAADFRICLFGYRLLRAL